MKKISLNRIRPERSKTRHLTVGHTTTMIVSIAPDLKATLQAAAKKYNLSLSLYVNLILAGQKKSPVK